MQVQLAPVQQVEADRNAQTLKASAVESSWRCCAPPLPTLTVLFKWRLVNPTWVREEDLYLGNTGEVQPSLAHVVPWTAGVAQLRRSGGWVTA